MKQLVLSILFIVASAFTSFSHNSKDISNNVADQVSYISTQYNINHEAVQLALNGYQKLRSLGFYITGGIYKGKHGASLELEGVEKGINDQAKDRAIVIHGADYVSNKFIKQQGYIGRSLGCPAVPNTQVAQIINTIKGASCLFVYAPTNQYLSQSQLVKN